MFGIGITVLCLALAPPQICGLDFFGLDHVLFASDTPFEPTPGLFIKETIKVLDSLDLTAEQRTQIYEGNARRLLKLN